MNVEFPKVKHKLPELFQEIINYDNKITALLGSKIVQLSSWKKVSSKRKELIRSADRIYRTPSKEQPKG